MLNKQMLNLETKRVERLAYIKVSDSLVDKHTLKLDP